MPSFLELELAKAADFIVRDSLRVKPGESLLITIDTETDFRVAEATARAGQTVDARVAVVWHTTPPGFGKVTDKYLPEPVKAAIPKADAWVEYNNQWILYSTPWEEAIKSKKVRYLCLGGIDVERLVRCVGKVDWKNTAPFLNKLAEMTKNAKKIRITNQAGNDISFEMGGRPVVAETMENHKPNACGLHAHFLGGQVIWAPVEESINGVIIFDGSLAGGGEAYFGTLKTPVKLEIENGKIISIDGGREAEIFSKWLKQLNDPRMYNLAHVCFGFNPGAKLTGVMVEDERVWGATEWGIGYQSIYYNGKDKPNDAITHVDGTCLSCSAQFDGETIIADGKLVSNDLKLMAGEINKE